MAETLGGAHPGFPAPGAIDQHDRVHPAKQFVGMKFDMEAHAQGLIAPALAAFQPQANVIVSLLLVEHDRVADEPVAHHVGWRMQPGGVRRGHDDSEIVGDVQIGQAVIHLIERARVRPGRRESRGGAQRIHRPHIELNDRGRGEAGNRSRVKVGHGGLRCQRHRRAAPRSPVGRPPDLAQVDSLRVFGHYRHRHGFTRFRDDARMMEAGEGRANVPGVTGILRSGRAIKRRHR